MYDTIISLFTVAVLAISAFGLGRLLLRVIGVGNDDWLTMVAYSIGLGGVASGLVLVPLGMAGLIQLSILSLLVIPSCCWGIVEAGIAFLQHEESVRRGQPIRAEETLFPWIAVIPTMPRWIARVFYVAVGLVFIASLLSALTPPTGSHTITEQLESAKRMVVEHRMVVAPDAGDALRPMLVDLWYVWAVALDGGVGAQLVHWAFGVLLMLGTVALASPIVGRSWCWACGTLVVLMPMTNHAMSMPTDSVALGAFGILTVAAWQQAVLHSVDWRWFVIAGISAGAMLSIRHESLGLPAALSIIAGWIAWRQIEQRRFILQGNMIMVGAALAVAALFHLPFLCCTPYAVGGCFDLSGELFGGCSHFGLLGLATLPGLILVRRLRGLGTALSIAVLYGLCIIVTGASKSLLLLPASILSLCTVWVWIELQRCPAGIRRPAMAAICLMLACNLAMSLSRSPECVPVAIGLEDREEYLLRHEPSYAAAAAANVLLQENAHLLSGEPQAFYFNCRVTSSRELLQALLNDPSPSELEDATVSLKKAGYTHLLLVEEVSATMNDGGKMLSTPVLSPLNRSRYRTADGSEHCYRLMVLR